MYGTGCGDCKPVNTVITLLMTDVANLCRRWWNGKFWNFKNIMIKMIDFKFLAKFGNNLLM